MASIFLRDETGKRPVYGGTRKFQDDPHWRDLILFYEYFHGDNGAGLGASHQTGWTGVVARAMHLFEEPMPGMAPDVALDVRAGAVPPTPATWPLAGDRWLTSPRAANPVLYQLNTRVHLTERSRVLGRPATLDDITDDELDAIAARGFEWVWLLSVWRTGPAGPADRSRRPGASPGVRGDAARSPRRGRRRLRLRDHRLRREPGPRRRRGARAAASADGDAWHPADARLRAQPHGDRSSVGREPRRLLRQRLGARSRCGSPRNYARVARSGRRGRPRSRTRPVLPRLDRTRSSSTTRTPQLCEAMTEVLRRDRRAAATASAATWRCSSCRTSSSAPGAGSPGPSGNLRSRGLVRRRPGSRFMAEVYWDLEWTMLQLGFDYAYDKRLYDRLVDRVRAPRARAPMGRSRLPGPPRAVPREPRRAASRGRLPARPARGRRTDHVPRAGPSIFPRRPAGRPPSPHLATPHPRPGRADRHPAGRLLRRAFGRPTAARRPERRLAAPRVHVQHGTATRRRTASSRSPGRWGTPDLSSS